MAALPYMQLYIADYLADTMHLSTEEQGVYLLLMFNTWQTGKPIPKSRLARIAKLRNDRWISVESSLAERLLTKWIKHAGNGLSVPPIRRQLAAQKRHGGPTPAQQMYQEYLRKRQLDFFELGSTENVRISYWYALRYLISTAFRNQQYEITTTAL